MLFRQRIGASLVVVFAFGLFAFETSVAQDVDAFRAGSFEGAAGATMPYRLFVPESAIGTGPLPLIIYLHGSAGRGTDNIAQISRWNIDGTHLWIAPEMQARHRGFVLAPQMPQNGQWGAPDSDELSPHAALLIELIAALVDEHAIDADRIYLIGQSNGGAGTWDLVSKRPELFAAAVPAMGWGNTTRVQDVRDLPIWALHGAEDQSIPVSESRNLVSALRSVGGNARYTEYPDVGHDPGLWSLAIEEGLAEWLFSQTRAR